MSRRHLILCCITILLLAVGVRLLVLHHNRAAIAPVMSGITAGYKNEARILARGDLRLFLRGTKPPSNATVLAHPPGYPILMAALFSLFGESDFALRFFQILCDAFSVVIVFLIALELFSSKSIAVIAGVLAALSPQLAYNSLLLLPDSLSALPVLLAVYILARARGKPLSWSNLTIAGALLGLSSWLRPNWFLLSLYFAALLWFLLPRGQRLRSLLPLLGAVVIVIAPMTIRNLIVFRQFIPISLGAGMNIVEGIADYDEDGRTGLPRTDIELMKWEAQMYNRPDYAGSFYDPDGIERERSRVAHGVNAIRSRPLWFIGVMIRRAASMMRLERVPAISGSPFVLGDNSATSNQPSMTAKLLRVPGVILKSIQKLFITAVMLPLCLIGIVLLWRTRKRDAMAMLLLVPVYYFCMQSLLHTEYRYVIAIQYFLLVFVAVTVTEVGNAIRKRALAPSKRRAG